VTRVAWLALLVFAPMVIEARRAGRNEREQRRRGGVEAAGDVYRQMQWAYPGAFLIMLVECALRGPSPASGLIVGALVFAAGKCVKWWAILALGSAWTFRVITVPGAPRVQRGPYRWLRHPNYLGVTGELVGIAIAGNARITGPLMTLGFGLMMVVRMRVENQAIARHLR
jgi:methyltransferase